MILSKVTHTFSQCVSLESKPFNLVMLLASLPYGRATTPVLIHSLDPDKQAHLPDSGPAGIAYIFLGIDRGLNPREQARGSKGKEKLP